jgi:hypothetical protein
VVEQEPSTRLELSDRVLVRRGDRLKSSSTHYGAGFVCGAWYVHVNTSFDGVFSNPDSNFDVGYMDTGQKLIGGLTFWEARRVALAMDDSDLTFSLDGSDLDPDTVYVVEAIIASALMDHYVFPIDRYFANRVAIPTWKTFASSVAPCGDDG